MPPFISVKSCPSYALMPQSRRDLDAATMIIRNTETQNGISRAFSPSGHQSNAGFIIDKNGLRNQNGFSLLELLIVMGIAAILFALAGPVISTLTGRGGLTKAVGDIQGIFEQARSYAVANNTYVYVGIQEVDAMTPTTNDGIGRVAVAVVASLTGQRPFGITANPNVPAALTSSNIVPLGPVHTFDNIHITNSSSLNSGMMSGRPTADLDLSSISAKTSFTWPVSGTTKYNFSKLAIEFSPQGIASVQTNSVYSTTLNNCLELALLPTHGPAVTNTPNQAAIQINGITGRVVVYRP